MRPFLFTLERRSGPGGAYRPWAVALIEATLGMVECRCKRPDGGIHRFSADALLDASEVARRVAYDLVNVLPRTNEDVLHERAPALHALLDELTAQCHVHASTAIYRGEIQLAVGQHPMAHEALEALADAEFSRWEQDMTPLPEDGLPGS